MAGSGNDPSAIERRLHERLTDDQSARYVEILDATMANGQIVPEEYEAEYLLLSIALHCIDDEAADAKAKLKAFYVERGMKIN